jgi:hypothetical protein
VHTSPTPGSFSHGQFTENYLIQPNKGLIQVQCLLKPINDKTSLRREIGDLKRSPCLLNVDELSPQTMLDVQVTQSCLANLFVGKLLGEKFNPLPHGKTSPF